MKQFTILTLCVVFSMIRGYSQAKVDFGDAKDGMVIARGTLGQTQGDTLGTLIFGKSDSTMYLDNGVEFKRIPYSDRVDELNSSDGRTQITTSSRSLTMRVDGTNIFKVDREGRIGFLTNKNNTYVGSFAGENHVEGEFNSFFGYNSGQTVKKSEDNTFLGHSAGYYADSTQANTYVGVYAGSSSKGNFNTFIGYNTGSGNLNGDGNIGIGAQTLSNDSIGAYNVAIGTLNMTQNRTGAYNVSLEYRTMDDFRSGGDNIGIGSGTMQYKQSGSFNIAVGKDAGGENTNGSSNIFIGNGAGYNEKGSEKLYIDQSTTSDPLVLGDFDKDELVIHGKLSVNNKQPIGALHVKQHADPTAVTPGQNLDTISGITLERSNGDITWHIAIDSLNGLNFSIGKTLKAYVDPASGKWITATGASPFTSIPTETKRKFNSILTNLNVRDSKDSNDNEKVTYSIDYAELKEQFPEAVVSNERFAGIDYDQITILNLSVLKNLITENEMLKKQLNAYEKRLDELDQLIVQLIDNQ